MIVILRTKNLKKRRNMDLRPLYTFTINDLGNRIRKQIESKI